MKPGRGGYSSSDLREGKLPISLHVPSEHVSVRIFVHSAWVACSLGSWRGGG